MVAATTVLALFAVVISAAGPGDGKAFSGDGELELAIKLNGETEEQAQGRHEQQDRDWSIVLSICALGATFYFGSILERNHVDWLPEAAVGVLLGFGTTFALKSTTFGSELLEYEQFDFEFFVVWLLPPIIFEAGFNMDVESFFENIWPTVTLAFLGTLVSTFIVGGLVWGAGQLGLCYPLSLLASLTFGSIISATDPVTVLAVFQALGVKSDLFSMVFGESVLNDAVAIVLSSTLISFTQVPVSQETLLYALGLFVTIFVGSLAIGAAFGVFSSIAFKSLAVEWIRDSHEDHKYIELAFSFCFPWAAYFCAEAMELSGIVAILSCGMTMATFTRPNLTKPAVTFTADAYRGIALIAETFVFVYLGMACMTFPIFTNPSWGLVIFSLLACGIGRLHVYVVSAGFNCVRTPTSIPPPISKTYQFIMWFSGLRGGVAFALASLSYIRNDFPTKCGGLPEGSDCPYGETSDSLALLQCTMMIALFTIFIFGGSISRVAIWLDVIAHDGDEKVRKNSREGQKPTMMKQMTTKLFDVLTIMPDSETGGGQNKSSRGDAKRTYARRPSCAPSSKKAAAQGEGLQPPPVDAPDDGGVRANKGSPFKDVTRDVEEEDLIKQRAAGNGRVAWGAGSDGNKAMV